MSNVLNPLPNLTLTNQVLTDDFGFNCGFPYNINGYTIRMTMKKSLSQSDANADAKVVATPNAVTVDDDGIYWVLLVIAAADISELDPISYYFDIVTKDGDGKVAHLVSPQSTVSFIDSVTENP